MTKTELLKKLQEIRARQDAPRECWGGPAVTVLADDHVEADALLIEFIGDAEVSDAFDAIEKWYA